MVFAVNVANRAHSVFAVQHLFLAQLETFPNRFTERFAPNKVRVSCSEFSIHVHSSLLFLYIPAAHQSQQGVYAVLLVKSITSLSVVEIIFEMSSNSVQCKKLVHCTCTLFVIFMVHYVYFWFRHDVWRFRSGCPTSTSSSVWRSDWNIRFWRPVGNPYFWRSVC